MAKLQTEKDSGEGSIMGFFANAQNTLIAGGTFGSLSRRLCT